MADAPISGLPETTTVGDNDLLLLQQNNTAKKIKGSNWKQYFNANVVTADASAIDPTDPPAATYDDVTNNLHLDLPTGDYFVSCTQTGTAGNKSIYTLTSALGHTAQFEVMNGTGGAPSDSDPVALGTASPGIDPEYSRADHVHPIPSADMVQALALSGTQYLVNPVDDLSNYATGFALFNNAVGSPVYNFPYLQSETQWALVISGKADAGTVYQVAYDLLGLIPPRTRNCASGTWSAWTAMTISADALNGAVPVTHGGLGTTSLADAKTALGIADSGWIEVTFTADFKNYGTSNKCQYRKFGSVVTVCGAATPVNDIAGSNTQYTMFTLPSGFRPKVVSSSIQQGSGDARWQMQIGSGNGAVTFSRYADDTGYITAQAGAWLVFSATFLTA